MPTGGAVTGGAHKKKKHGKKKKAGTKTLEEAKKTARRMGIPLSKGGHAKTKSQLLRAISSH